MERTPSRHRMILTVGLTCAVGSRLTNDHLAAQVGQHLLKLWGDSERPTALQFNAEGFCIEMQSHGELLEDEVAVLLAGEGKVSRPGDAGGDLLAYGLLALQIEAKSRSG